MHFNGNQMKNDFEKLNEFQDNIWDLRWYDMYIKTVNNF